MGSQTHCQPPSQNLQTAHGKVQMHYPYMAWRSGEGCNSQDSRSELVANHITAPWCKIHQEFLVLGGVQLPAPSQPCHPFMVTNDSQEAQRLKAAKWELFHSIVLLQLPACMAYAPLTVSLKAFIATIPVWALHLSSPEPEMGISQLCHISLLSHISQPANKSTHGHRFTFPEAMEPTRTSCTHPIPGCVGHAGSFSP